LVQALIQEVPGARAVPDFAGVHAAPFPVDGGDGSSATARFDLSVAVHRTDDGGLAGVLVHRVDRLDRTAAELIAEAWYALLEEAAGRPQAPVAQVCERALRILSAITEAAPEPASAQPEQTADEAEPGDGPPALREALARIWGVLLDVDEVGDEDHFFRLGGHSLLAV
jgi:hypothetical protein